MAVMLMIVLAGAGILITGGVDFMSVSTQSNTLQGVADRAALAAAQELIVARADDDRVTAVASRFVAANYSDPQVTSARVIENGRAVEVTIEATPRAFFSTPFAEEGKKVRVEAVAEVSGGGYVCMVGLDTNSVATLKMMNGARLTAESCAVYSSSTSEKSLWVMDTARVDAELICVAGGVMGSEQGFTGAQPTADCPQLDDPLRDRPQPEVSQHCDYTNFRVLAGQVKYLRPGVYCGGIRVLGGVARLDPGIYVLKDGPLYVDLNGTLTGAYVGFFLTGRASIVQFARFSHISLSAPKSGAMAGLLFFEDRTTTFDTYHRITSRDARNLVGTMYFPKSKLMIDSRDPVADRSDYTIIIAREFELRDGPELVLNTDYASSNIPVPEGVGPNTASSVRLTH